MKKPKKFHNKVKHLPNGKLVAKIVCQECGKPLTVVNEHGMFCEDRCGEEESKRMANPLKKLVEDFGKLFGESL